MRSERASQQRLFCLALATVAFVACEGGDGPPSGGGGAADSDYWSRPWNGTAKEVPTAADAQAKLPFHMLTPRVPEGLRGIFLPPVARAPDLMAVWFVYKDTKYGWVWVGESLPDIPDAAERDAGYAERVSRNGQPGAAHCDMVQIRGGVTASPCTSKSGGTMEWVQDGVQFTIEGPSLTRQDLLDLGNGV